MSRVPLALALTVFVLGCGPNKKSGGASKSTTIASDAFDLRVDVPKPWTISSVESTESRFLLRLEQADWILWIAARETETVVDPLTALRERSGTMSSLKTTWMSLGAAMVNAEAAFTDNSSRAEERLLAVSGLCHYEMTLSAPREAAAQMRPMLLELRGIVNGLSGVTPRAPGCAAPAPPADIASAADAGPTP